MAQTPNRRAFTATTLPRIILAAVVILILAVTVFRSGWKSEQGVAASPPMQEPMVPDTMSSAAHAPSPPRLPARAQPPPGPRAMQVEQRAATQQHVDGTHAALASQYRNQKADPAWAPGKERELAGLGSSDQIKDMKADIANMTVDCKASVCKISGDFKTITAGDDWLTLYMGNLGSKLPSASYKYVRNADGTLRIEIYGVGR